MTSQIPKSVRLPAETWARLERLAEAMTADTSGVVRYTRADAVRMLIAESLPDLEARYHVGGDNES
jgi:predicted DNA-binding protein